MFCPKCGVEYRAGFFECSDCGVLLVHEPSPDAPRNLDAPANEVIVFESAVPGEAEMIAGALEEAGIPPVVRRSVAGGMRLGFLEPGLTIGHGMAVSVPQIAAEQAARIVESLRPHGAEDHPPTSPGEEASPVTGIPERGKAVARVILAVLLIPLFLVVLSAVVAAVREALR